MTALIKLILNLSQLKQISRAPYSLVLWFDDLPQLLNCQRILCVSEVVRFYAHSIHQR